MGLDDQALIVPIIKWAGRVFCYGCALTSLPSLLLIHMTRGVCALTKTSLALQLLLALPRFLLVWTVPLLVLLIPFAVGVALGLGLQSVWMVGLIVGLALIFTNVVGLITVNIDRYLKPRLSFYRFLSCDDDEHCDCGGLWFNLWDSLLDVLAGAATLFNLVTLIRIPAVCLALFATDGVSTDTNSRDFVTRKIDAVDRSLRQEMFYSALMVLLDLLLLPVVLLLLLVVPWRIPGTLRQIRKHDTGTPSLLKTFDSLSVRGIILYKTVSGFLDILCFSSLVLFLLAPWRFSCVTWRAPRLTIAKLRRDVLFQALQSVIDSLFILLSLTMLLLPLFGWVRFLVLLTLLFKYKPRASDTDVASNRRHLCLFQFLLALFDCFTFLVCLLPLCLTIYRLPILLRKWRKPTKTWSVSLVGTTADLTDPSAQLAVWKQSWAVICDLPFFAMAAIVLCLSWRSPLLIRDLYRINHPLGGAAPSRHRRDERVSVIWHHFLYAFIDVFIFAMAAFVTVFFPWRGYYMWRNIKRATITSSRYEAVLYHFGQSFVDLPYAICATIVTLLLWRAWFLWAEIYRLKWAAGHRTDVRASETRRVFLRHFGMLFIDIIDAPFVVLCLGIVVTLWRLPALIKGLKSSRTRNEARKVVLKELALWLLDMPTFFAFFIVLITLYRAKTMLVAVHSHLSNFWSTGTTATTAAATPTTTTAHAAEDVPAPAVHGVVQAATWHRVVWANFGLVMLDIPFPLLILLTLWRFPICVRRVWKECESARERRITILSCLWSVCKDVPCIVLAIPLVLTVWRVPSLIHMFKSLERGDNEHRLFLSLYLQWLIDLPFALCLLLIAILLPWRLFGAIRSTLHITTGAKDRRVMLATYLAIGLLDIPVVCLLCFSWLVFPWRVRYFFSQLQHFNRERSAVVPADFWRHTRTLYSAVGKHASSGLSDLPAVCVSLLMVVFWWRWGFFIWWILVRNWGRNADWRKRYVWRYLFVCVADFISAVFFCTICLIAPWRLSCLVLKTLRAFHENARKFAPDLLPPALAPPPPPPPPPAPAGAAAPPPAVAHEEEDDEELPEFDQDRHFIYSFSWFEGCVMTWRKSLRDLPYVLLGTLLTLFCCWRAVPFLYHIFISRATQFKPARGKFTTHRLEKGDWYRYNVCLSYAHYAAIDLLAFPLFLLSLFLAPWRLGSFVAMFKHEVPVFGVDHFKHSDALYYAVWRLVPLAARDVWMLVNLLFVVLGVAHLPCLIKGVYVFYKMKQNRDHSLVPLPTTTTTPVATEAAAAAPPTAPERPVLDARHTEIWDETNELLHSWEHVPMLLSPTVFWVLVRREFQHTLDLFPTFFLVPLKLLALPVVPVFYYINWRVGIWRLPSKTPPTPDTPEPPPLPKDGLEAMERHKTLSFLAIPVWYIQSFFGQRLSFFAIHDILLCCVISVPLMLWNELAHIPMLINHVLLLFTTLFDPLWKPLRVSAGYTLGSPPNTFWTIIELTIAFILAFTIPCFFLLQLVFPLLPIWIFGSTQFTTQVFSHSSDPSSYTDIQPGFVLFWQTFFKPIFWTDFLASVPAWMWFLSALWWALLPPSWHLLFRQKSWYDLFQPLNIYLIVLKRLFAGALWKGYKGVLAKGTSWSYVHRRSCCLLGQWTVVLVFILWCFWPFLVLPLIVGLIHPPFWYLSFIPPVPVSVFLVWRAYQGIKKHWKSPPKRIHGTLSNVLITCQFPESGGIRLRVKATKPAEMVIQQAMLYIEGDELWKAIAKFVPGGQKGVSTFKILFYPVKLCPDYLHARDFRSGEESVSTDIEFGMTGKFKFKKKLIMRYGRRIVEESGDPVFKIRVEYGEKTFRWVRHGVLFEHETRMSTVIHAAENSLPLTGGTPPPVASTSAAASTSSASGGQHVIEIEAPQPPPHVEPEPEPHPTDTAVEMEPTTHEEPTTPTPTEPSAMPSATLSVEQLRSKHREIIDTAVGVGVVESMVLGALLVLEAQHRPINQDSVFELVLADPIPDEVVAASLSFV